MGRSTLISPNTTQAHIQTTSRMNKLLMLAFLVTLMGLMATAAPQEEMDDMELEEFDIEEAIESREVREAGRKRKGQNKKNRKRLGRKRTAKKSAKKNGRKQKKQKAVRKSQGGRNNKDTRSGSYRASTDYTCLLNAMTYLNLTKTQVANYLKQQGRIIAANKTGEKKNGKKGIFAATAQRIIRSGGGNSAALSCQGSTTSNGAKNLTDLAALLNGCEAKVKTACSTENMPLPNITEVSACVDAKMTSKGMVDKSDDEGQRHRGLRLLEQRQLHRPRHDHQGLQAERRPEGGDCAAEELQDRVLCLQTGRGRRYEGDVLLRHLEGRPARLRQDSHRELRWYRRRQDQGGQPCQLDLQLACRRRHLRRGDHHRHRDHHRRRRQP